MMDVFSAVEHSVELIRPNDEPNVKFFYFFDHEEPTPSCGVCSTGEIMDIFTYARPCSLH